MSVRMIKKPQLSVLMSVYNSEEYLNEAIDSILSQTFEDYEFIIIDDGSTDSSSSILSFYAEKDSRIIIISNESNIGLTLSLNKGIEIASSNLIARMDADDVAIRERLQIQMDFMRENPDIDVCGSFTKYLENPNQGDIHATTHEGIVSECFFYCPFAHPTVIMRKDKILTLTNGYDPYDLYAEDYGLWSRLVMSEQAHFANINKSLLNYRTHPNIPRIEYRQKQRKTTNLIQQKMFLSIGVEIPLEDISLINHSKGKISISDVKKCEFWFKKLESATDNWNEIKKYYFLAEIKKKKMYLWRRVEKKNLPSLFRYIFSKFFYKKFF